MNDDHRVLVLGVYARYARTGHLLYVTADGTLMAVPFDQESMELAGDRVALVNGIPLRSFNSPDFAVADDGTLMYSTGGAAQRRGEPVWVERDGRAEPVAVDWTQTAVTVALSPGGTQLAAAIDQGGEQHIWVRHLVGGTNSKLTFAGTSNGRPDWVPDGRSLLFVSNRQSVNDLFVRRADGTAEAHLLLQRAPSLQEGRLTRDGNWLVYRQGGGANSDLYARRMTGDTVPVPLAITQAQETAPAMSPNGRWLAYTSDETGVPEVYVRPFPDVAGKWLVSASGGTEPLWSRDGRELFYRNGNGDMVAVEVVQDGTPPTGRQRVLFSARPYAANVFHQLYDVTPDGQRFVMLRPRADGGADGLQLVVVENFFEELKERVGR